MMRDERPQEEFELQAVDARPRPGYQRQCLALCAATGRRCTRMTHADVEHNASGHRFRLTLQPGASLAGRELDVRAFSHPSNPMEAM